VAGVRLGRPWPALRIALLVIGLVLGATIVVDRVIDARRPLAVVIADESILRKGNGDGFDPQIAEPLGSGVEVLIREERPGWLRVRLADGTEGWLRAEDVERVAG
jgi:SH3-like domain-containing protein